MATEYLTKPDIDMTLESLRYTKEAFYKYQGSTRLPSSSKNVSEHRSPIPSISSAVARRMSESSRSSSWAFRRLLPRTGSALSSRWKRSIDSGGPATMTDLVVAGLTLSTHDVDRFAPR